MTNLSPSEAELKNKIEAAVATGAYQPMKATADIMQLFARYSKQQALAARIEEMEHMQANRRSITAWWYDYTLKRIAELRNLKAQEGGEG